MKITLREITLDDANRVLEVAQNQEVMKYTGQEVYQSIDTAIDEINWFLELRKRYVGFRYAIVDENDRYIGNIGVFDYNSEHNRAELGFMLDQAYWNQGILSHFIPIVLQECFEVFFMKRVYAYVDPENIGSRRVLLKAGFEYEGTLRSHDYEPSRGYVDLQVYAIINQEPL